MSLVEPAGQKLPGVEHARQLAADVKAAPPVEYVPTGHGAPLGLPAPAQKRPAAHATPVVDVVPDGQ